MRLKVQSVPPLPVLKVWFTPGEQCATVANLKSALAREVFAFKQKNASPLELSLDGFDLLENSSLQDVLRDGDLVLVKTNNISSVGKKRKRSISPIRKEKTRSLPPPLASSSSSSSSSDSESSTSSSFLSSSSSSDTDSESDSSSSSSGSSVTPQTSASPKRVAVPQAQVARKTFTRPPTTKPIVPPGKGKPGTHSRNQRRRLKKKATLSAAAPLPGFVSAANATPVAKAETEAERRAKAKRHGPAPDVASALNNAFGGNERTGRLDPGTLRASPVSACSSTLHTPLYPPSEVDAEETLSMHMLSFLPKSKNKNKSRRGVQEIDPRSRKIVFGSPPPPQVPLQNEMVDEETRNLRPVLIPPSSLPEHLIPSNMFITCVDVEEGLKKPKKKKRKDQEENWAMNEPVPDTIVLDYGEEGGSEMVVEESYIAQPSLDLGAFDLDAAPAINSHTDLTEGCIVGFEGLIMNLKTFAPEVGKRYGRVLNWSENAMTVRPIVDGEEENEDEELDWKEVQGQWKLLQRTT
ncbi:hypothetical protein MSAN_00713000 [Mycena sanguinolenta]|uniref:Coilin n=1 Tax=Mycena sanguinolenta TaxID=230812 RepID=A0A8H7DDW2_9AGAR|nr:hypothetical protein MSAN_00713000 [Mycena sanguinolenta]